MNITLQTLAAIGGIAFGSNAPATIPVPRDPQGQTPLLKQGGTMTDGTLLVSDSADRVWWTRDTGRHWDTIPRFTRLGPRYQGSGFAGWSPLDPEIFHGTVLSKGKEGWWTPDSGWKDAILPDECMTNTGESMTDRPGLMGNCDESGNTVTFCRSGDGGRSWKAWFSFDRSVGVPTGSRSPFGSLAEGMIWYTVADSGYIRGTSDGVRWRRIAPPPPLQAGRVYSGSARNIVVIPANTSSPDSALVSSDTGGTWTNTSLSKPGVFVHEATSGFVSYAPLSSNQWSTWISISPEGPWILADSSVGTGALWLGAAPYKVAAHAIERLELVEASTIHRTGFPKPAIRWRNGWLELPASSRSGDRRWKIADPTGRILSTGSTSGNRIRFATTARGAWILELDGIAFELVAP